MMKSNKRVSHFLIALDQGGLMPKWSTFHTYFQLPALTHRMNRIA